MRSKSFFTNWQLFILIWVLLLAACSSETPVTEQPLPEQPEATVTPTEEAMPEPQAPPQADAEGESDEEMPEISQPIARWNAVSEQGNWVLIGYGDALNPTVVEPGTYVTINFSSVDGVVSGSGGCNNYTSSYSADDDGNLTINGPVGSTLMACETGMEQEGVFIGAIETVTGYTVTEKGHLLLNYDSGTVYDEQLTFIPEAQLVDTVWFLTAYGDPENPTLARADVVTTLVFLGEGTLNGNTGCNNYTASYTLQGSQITIGLPAINLAVCEVGMEQEQAYLALLKAAQSYRLGVNALEIITSDGQVLRFTSSTLSLENVRWQLSFVDGQPISEDVSANLLFTPADSPVAQSNENVINGNAGCNTFFGSYTLAGNAFTTGPLGLTQMMCAEPVMQVEQALLAGLESVQSYQIEQNQLIIQAASGSLIFDADRLPLEGSRWILTGRGPIDDPQPPAADTVFTAVFKRPFGMPSGVKSGATGCNDYTATYYPGVDEIKVNLPKTSQNACSDAQMEAEQAYFLGLNAARDYRILGNELYVYYDNQVLIFVGSYEMPEHVPPPGPLAPLDGTQWWLTTIDNSIVIPGSEVSISFDIDSNGRTGSISGSGGCNSYNADIADVFTLWTISASTTVCDDPESVMDQEETYLAALQKANSIFIEGNTLRIKTDAETLYFTSRVPDSALPTPTPEGPSAVIIAPSNENVGQLIVYDASLSVSNAEITSYRWWFSDDTTEYGVKVERIYNTVGAYDAILTITDAKGQTAEASIKVRIHPYLVGSTWVFGDGNITLSFGDGVLSGNAGCNDYNASYTAATDVGVSNSISVSSLTVTDDVCDDDVMDEERIYLDSLQTASSYVINLNKLTITVASGTLTLYLK